MMTKDPARIVTCTPGRPTVGANCRGIVESSRDIGAIRLGIHTDGREKTWGEERSGIPVTGLHTVYPASDHTTVA